MYLTGYTTYPNAAEALKAFSLITKPAVLRAYTVIHLQAAPVQHGQAKFELDGASLMNTAALAIELADFA